MANKVTIHFKEDRIERATYISKTVGFGEVVRTAEFYRTDGLYTILKITETGVVIITSASGAIVTMYIAKPEQLIEIYKQNRWGRVPTWLMTKAQKNWKKGYTQNQPDFK